MGKTQAGGLDLACVRAGMAIWVWCQCGPHGANQGRFLRGWCNPALTPFHPAQQWTGSVYVPDSRLPKAEDPIRVGTGRHFIA